MNHNNHNNNIPTIDSLQQEKSKKEQSKSDIFNIVLNKCIEKIVYTNRHTDKTFVIFEVPKILIGYPMYDMRSCLLFLIGKLSANGYLVEFIDPFYLYIDWGCAQQSKYQSSSSSKKTAIIPGQYPEKLRQRAKSILQQFPDTSKVEFVYEDTLRNSSKHKKKIKK
ncbi:hypothetical protein EBU95_04315 [bacterium]|nr:hypothetical protein [bacterium]